MTNYDNTCFNNHSLPEERINKKVMLIKVIRDTFNTECTLGKMYIDGALFAHTLEDPFRNLQGDMSRKVKGDTCIDPGVFKAVLSMSNRLHKILPEILKVPCFEGIRIHGGNKSADTEGCILIGANTNGVNSIWGCAEKVQELIDRMQGKDVTIEVSGNATT